MKRVIYTFILAIFFGSIGYCQKGQSDWKMYRGDSDLTGRVRTPLPPKPVLKWSYKTNARTVSSPVISNGTVFFGNNDGTIFAITSDGKLKWKYETGTAVEASPVVLDGKVIYGSLDGDMRALDAATGKLVWIYQTENQIFGSVNIWNSGDQKLIVFGSYDFCLHCVNPRTGKQVWKFETDNFVHGTPAISRSKIVFGGCDGLIRIVDPTTGIEKRFADLQVYIASSPAIVGNHAYVGSHEGIFYSIDLQSMTIDWEVPPRDEFSIIMATPAINIGKVVVGSEDKYVYCYDIKDGEKLWEFRTSGRVVGSAVITDSDVLLGSRDGFIYILDLETGKKKWSFDTGKPISCSPAVINDMFCILTEDGRLLSFGN